MKIRKKAVADAALLEAASHFNLEAIASAAELLHESDPKELRAFLGACLMLSMAASEFVMERSDKSFQRLCVIEQTVRNAIIYGPPEVRDLLMTKPS